MNEWTNEWMNSPPRTGALLLAPCISDDKTVLGAIGVVNHAKGHTGERFSAANARFMESVAALVCSWVASTRSNEIRLISERKKRISSSPHLLISPHISTYLVISPHISSHPSTSHHISSHLLTPPSHLPTTSRKALSMVDLSASLAKHLDDREHTSMQLLDAALSIMGAQVAVLYIVQGDQLIREGWAQVPQKGSYI